MRAFPSSVVVLFGALGIATLVTLTACGGGVVPGSGDGTGANGSRGSSGGSGSGSGSGSASDGTNEPGGEGARAPGTPAGGTNGSAGSTTCKYPTIVNPTECPPAYTRQPPPSCASIGLKCWYPGVGDGDGNGCWATALLACVGSAGADAGDDGGAPPTGHWIGAQ